MYTIGIYIYRYHTFPYIKRFTIPFPMDPPRVTVMLWDPCLNQETCQESLNTKHVVSLDYALQRISTQLAKRLDSLEHTVAQRSVPWA